MLYYYMPVRIKILQYAIFSNITLLRMKKCCNSAHAKKGEEEKILQFGTGTVSGQILKKIVKQLLHLLLSNLVTTPEKVFPNIS